MCRPEIDIRIKEWMTGMLSSARRGKTNPLTEHTGRGCENPRCRRTTPLGMAASVRRVVGMWDRPGCEA